jgi:RNA polymerase sigma-70 factor (ECF subfamily)
MSNSLVASNNSVEGLLAAMRPRLHRYCARMTGSVIDGEDVVQEVCVKAIEAVRLGTPVENSQSWLFQIAHNASLDFLRRRKRRNDEPLGGILDMTADPAASTDRNVAAAASLRLFMELPALQRSSVILTDVLGYTVDEIGFVTGASVPAIKAALHRGRALLRSLARQADRALPVLEDAERARLERYVACFNARDFDGIRDLLADEVRLDLVNRTRMNGRSQVAKYFGSYASVGDWRLAPGLIDGRPAALVLDSRDGSASPAYFIVLQWAEGKLSSIRDFRYARYVIESADVVILGDA